MIWHKQSKKKDSSLRTTVRDFLISLGALTAATLVNWMIQKLSMQSSTFVSVYILSVLMIALNTTGFFWGILASVLSVLAMNFIFTYPFYAFNFILQGYPITFLCMLLIAIVTSTLATSMKEQRRLSEEKRQITLEKQREEMRGNLLRAISHDLRTPLTGILGASSALLENQDRIDRCSRHRLLCDIRDDAQWLLRMVENVLSVTKIGAAAPQLRKLPEAAEEVVAQAVGRCRKRFPKTEFIVKVPNEFLMVPMDATLIEQVLLNLMENAVFHGAGSGPVDVTVYIKRKMACFSVRDYGKGIPPDRLKTLFDGFSSAAKGGDVSRGLGIGLSLCRSIIIAHHGKITGQNMPDGGAEFVFTLPIEEEENADYPQNIDC